MKIRKRTEIKLNLNQGKGREGKGRQGKSSQDKVRQGENDRRRKDH